MHKLFLLLFFFLLFISSSNAIEVNKINIYSDKLNLEENISHFENNVVLIYEDFTLEADKIIFDKDNEYIYAQGNIRAIYNDIEILCDTIEVNIKSNSVIIKNSLVNINNIIKFKSNEIFINNNFVDIKKLEFSDNDDKLFFLKYKVILENLKVLPVYKGRFFFLQINDINFSAFDFDKILPISIPQISTFIRNPNLPRNYINQRRIRGFFEIGSFFSRVGSDALRGPWISTTIPYFSNDFSNGFITTEYGLLSQFDIELYQDFTDNKGSLIQFTGNYQQYNRLVKNSLLTSSFNIIRDFENSAVNLRFDLNQNISNNIVSRLPEVSINSIYKQEDFTKINYRYDILMTHFLVNNKDHFSRIRTSLDLLSPKINITDDKYFLLLSQVFFSNYVLNSNQYGLNYQVQFTHELFKNFDYTLRYRQRLVDGKSPLVFENTLPNQLIGFLINWWITDYIELASLFEYSVYDNKPYMYLFTKYNTDFYSFSLIASVFEPNINANVRLLKF